MNRASVEKVAFLVVFAWIVWLTWGVFSIFFSPLVMAAVLAMLFIPLYDRVRTYTFGRSSIAAFIIVGIVFCFVVVPLFMIGWQLVLEAQNGYITARSSGEGVTALFEHLIETPIRHIDPSFSIDITQYVGATMSYIANNIGGFISSTVSIGFETFLMLVALLYFLIDGRELVTALRRMSPLNPQVTSALIDNTYLTVLSVMKGTFLVGIIRWAMISASFYLFGIPNFILWGSIGGLIASVPALGAPFAYIPAMIYLYVTDSSLMVIGMGIVGLLVTLVSDNILTPYFYGKGFTAPSILVLFSVLGGILFFGPTGFILGPLVLSTGMMCVKLYDTALASHDPSSPI